MDLTNKYYFQWDSKGAKPPLGRELCVKSGALYLCEESASREGNPQLGSGFLTWFFRCMKGS